MATRVVELTGGGRGVVAASKRAAPREETWDGVLRPIKPWQHEPAVTKEQVLRMRSEFWDTQPHYGGSRGALQATSSPSRRCIRQKP